MEKSRFWRTMSRLAKDTGLRELQEKARRLVSDRRKPAVQFDKPGDDSMLDEDSKMEVDDEAVCRTQR